MSYDLHFTARGSVPTRDELMAWFRERDGYEVSEEQAVYENPETQVYFRFALPEPTLPDQVAVAFHLNYFRPHVFALEAAPELRALVDRFQLDVSDPQLDGMGDGAFTEEGFRRGWERGNAFACEVYLTHPGAGENPVPPTLPRERLEAVWNWNLLREEMQDYLGSVELLPCYVPSIFLLAFPGATSATTAVVWGQSVPILLPPVDQVIVVPSRAVRPVHFEMEQVEPLVERYPRRGPGWSFELEGPRRVVQWPFRVVEYEEAPPELVEGLAALVPFEFEGDPTRLGLDGILEEELLVTRQTGGLHS